jgi:predicted transcriptional regulator
VSSKRPAGLGPGGLFLHKRPEEPEGLCFCGQSTVKSTVNLGGEVSRFFGSGQPSFIQLGPLEKRLLESVWTRGSVTVRELIADGELKIAYTTVMTTLDRLFKKKLLNRTAEGRAFRYSPRISREELQRAAAGHAIQQLLASGSASLPLSYLVEAVTEHDIELLDELQKLVESKRREFQEREKQ